MNVLRLKIEKLVFSRSNTLSNLKEPVRDDNPAFFDQPHFHHLLRVERKRTERSKKPFLLVLFDISRLIENTSNTKTADEIKTSLNMLLREVDVRGWYEYHKIIGVLITEIAQLDQAFIDKVIHKIYDRFYEKLNPSWLDHIYLSYHVFPESNQGWSEKEPFNIKLYPDLLTENMNNKFYLLIKTIIDRTGSAVALLFFAPLFLMIGIAIKVTSPGPVLFRQERVGTNGKTFIFYKFRSMVTNNDPRKHKEYIERLINQPQTAAVEPGIFKLTHDNRITTVGHFLRKTSLDELPQLLNVLKGDMSLVGPRPPIPYECDLYQIWHRRRLLSLKPGITGLWQVTGRSRTTFDEMVRLDLQYMQKRNLLLDLKILLMTPKAVISGSGAF